MNASASSVYAMLGVTSAFCSVISYFLQSDTTTIVLWAIATWSCFSMAHICRGEDGTR